MAAQIEPGKGKAAGIISIFLLILALVNLITGCIWASYGGKDANGIWSALLLLPPGICGIIAWCKLNKCAMIAFLVFCIIDIIVCIVQAVFAAIAFLIWQILKAIIETKCTISNGKCDCGNENIPIQLEDCSWISAIEAMFLVLIIVNGIAVIFVFAGSIIGCIATCCASNPQQTQVVVVQQPGVVLHQTSYGGQPQQGEPHKDPPPTYN